MKTVFPRLAPQFRSNSKILNGQSKFLINLKVFIVTFLKITAFFITLGIYLKNSITREKNSVTWSDPEFLTRSSCSNKDPSFVFLSPIDWDFRFQRPQHIALGVAKKNYNSIYVNPSIRISYFSKNYYHSEFKDGVWVLTIFLKFRAIYVGAEPITSDESELIARILEDFIIREDLGVPTIVIQQPGWHRVAERLCSYPLVFDSMDLHSGFSNISSEIIAVENTVMRIVDKIFVSSQGLYDLSPDFALKKTSIIRNATDVDHFSNVGKQSQINADQKTIGYFGALSDWFDAELIATVAKENPDISIEIIGSVTESSITTTLSKYANIRFFGEVPYSLLPQHIGNWDIGLIPFKINELIKATNPVKLYEYSASGIPTVSTAIPEVITLANQVSGGIFPSTDTKHFLENIQSALACDELTRNSLRDWATQNTWENRVESFINEQPIDPLVTVIVLMWNNSELTIKCLESIYERSNYGRLEVIVVDNFSDESESQAVQDWIQKNTKLDCHFVRNTENLGFAGGNNVGLTKSTGNYIILLNNDTEVTPGWIRRAIRHFQLNPNLGLLGPSTDNCGNEARVLLKQINKPWLHEVIPRFGFRPLMSFNNPTIAFFCAIMPRSTFEKVGYLSLDFGRGYFEDDDYCRRVESSGLEIAIARDIFIHHEMDASFGALPSDEKKELFLKNKILYESKWGRWKPHSYARDADSI